MNTKFLLQDLIDQLSEQGNIKKKDAEEFVKAFFKIIEDALFQGEIVKINGFGIFKLVKVEPRKSVNVSTGQEIEIKEHFKITFTPEQTIKELVNIPLSHLEPVQLDGGTEKDSLKDDQSDTEENVVIEQSVEEYISSDLIEEHTEYIDPQPSRTIKSKSMTPNERETPNRKDSEKNSNTDNSRYTDNKRSNENIPSNGIKKPIPAPQRPSRPSYQKPKPSMGNVFWIILLVIVSSLGIWAFWSNREAMKEKQRKMTALEQFDSTVYEEGDEKDFDVTVDDSLSVEAEIAAKIDSISKVDKPVKHKEDGNVKVNPKSTVKMGTAKQTAKQIAKQTAIPKVSTTVKRKTVVIPNTTGVAFPLTVTMEKGDRLTMLALKYYGNKVFWVYIYAANRKLIPNPNNVPLGTKIRIPSPDPSRTDPNNPECIFTAKALQTKIMSMLEN